MEENERVILAKSAYTPSFETMLQAYRATRRPWVLVLVCVGCAMIITGQMVRIGIGVVQILIFDRPIYSAVSMWIAVLCVLFGVFLLLWTLFAPRRNAKRRMKQIGEMFATLPTGIAVFDADGIEMIETRAQQGVRFSYGVLKACTETEDLFVFLTKERQFFSVEKQRLELVDEAGLRRLIAEKCPKAKCRFRREA